MAEYIELRSLFNDAELLNRVEVACLIAAKTIREESEGTINHANRLVWAAAAFRNTSTIRGAMLRAIIADNNDATVEQIQGVTDAALQALVDAAIDLFATGS